MLSDQFVWQGAMITGLPNFAICIGYTNASWTLRADLTSRLVCKILNWMDRHDHASVVPNPTEDLAARPLLDLAAGYVQRSIDAFPRQSDHGVWRVRQNYVLDAATTMRHNLRKTLATTPRSAVRRPATADDARAGGSRPRDRGSRTSRSTATRSGSGSPGPTTATPGGAHPRHRPQPRGLAADPGPARRRDHRVISLDLPGLRADPSDEGALGARGLRPLRRRAAGRPGREATGARHGQLASAVPSR